VTSTAVSSQQRMPATACPKVSTERPYTGHKLRIVTGFEHTGTSLAVHAFQLHGCASAINEGQIYHEYWVGEGDDVPCRKAHKKLNLPAMRNGYLEAISGSAQWHGKKPKPIENIDLSFPFIFNKEPCRMNGGSGGMGQHIRNMLEMFPQDKWDIAFFVPLRHPIAATVRESFGSATEAMAVASMHLSWYEDVVSVARRTKARIVMGHFETLVKQPAQMLPRLCEALGMDPSLLDLKGIVVKGPNAPLIYGNGNDVGHWGYHSSDAKPGIRKMMLFQQGHLFKFKKQWLDWKQLGDDEQELRANRWGYSFRDVERIQPVQMKDWPSNLVFVNVPV